MDYGQQGGFAMPRMTPGVKLLLIVNAAVFLANAVLRGSLSANWLSLSWEGLSDGYGLGVLRVLTYQFTHSFRDPFHLLMNMLVLYFFGTMVESQIGKVRLYWLYFWSGLIGGLLHMVITPQVPVVGASGACYGIMVYAAFLAPRMRVIFFIFPVEIRWLVGFLVFVGVYQLYVDLGRSGGVSHGAHLGGALWGAIAFRMARAGVGPDFGIGGRVGRWKAGRDAKAGQQKQQVLDELLEKVHREGLTSLTPAERRFLDKASQQMRRK